MTNHQKLPDSGMNDQYIAAKERWARKMSNGMPKLNRSRSSNKLILKTIILSDDTSMLAKAESTLLRVGSHSQVDAHWIVKSWPVNSLMRASLGKEALIEASDSHLVILPMRRAHSFTSWLRDWLHRWAGLREIQDAAVAVIDDDACAEFSRTVSPELNKFVLHHNLNLFIEQGSAVGNATKRTVNPAREREFPALLELRRLNNTVASNSIRNFGINE